MAGVELEMPDILSLRYALRWAAQVGLYLSIVLHKTWYFLFFHDLSASFKIVCHDYALLTHNLDSKE